MLSVDNKFYSERANTKRGQFETKVTRSYNKRLIGGDEENKEMRGKERKTEKKKTDRSIEKESSREK